MFIAPLLTQRPGESAEAFQQRQRRASTAKGRWVANERLDAARGLPPTSEPDWNDDTVLDAWQPNPWRYPAPASQSSAVDLEPADILDLSTTPPDAPAVAWQEPFTAQPWHNPLAEQRFPWENALAALPPPPDHPSAAELIERHLHVDAAVTSALPPTVAGGGANRSLAMHPSTAAKYIRAGAKVGVQAGKVVLRVGAKTLPWVAVGYRAYRALNAVNDLLPDQPSREILPRSEYQLGSNSIVLHWPDGSVTPAPPDWPG